VRLRPTWAHYNTAVSVSRKLTTSDLANSDVVANSLMNRTRRLSGVNSYERELGMDITGLFMDRFSWLDLCCGAGVALVEAVQRAMQMNVSVTIAGMDLIDDFAPAPGGSELTFKQGGLPDDLPAGPFDLITCVHGLHYIGDKIGLLEQLPALLTSHGRFVGNLDHTNIKGENGKTLPGILKWLNRSPLSYSKTSHRITIQQATVIETPFEYLGADDQAGPNYTMQPVVDSCYRRKSEQRV